jgi:hypothetical protein
LFNFNVYFLDNEINVEEQVEICNFNLIKQIKDILLIELKEKYKKKIFHKKINEISVLIINKVSEYSTEIEKWKDYVSDRNMLEKKIKLKMKELNTDIGKLEKLQVKLIEDEEKFFHLINNNIKKEKEKIQEVENSSFSQIFNNKINLKLEKFSTLNSVSSIDLYEILENKESEINILINEITLLSEDLSKDYHKNSNGSDKLEFPSESTTYFKEIKKMRIMEIHELDGVLEEKLKEYEIVSNNLEEIEEEEERKERIFQRYFDSELEKLNKREDCLMSKQIFLMEKVKSLENRRKLNHKKI